MELAKWYGRKWLGPREALRIVCGIVVGFDIDSLSALTSRTTI